MFNAERQRRAENALPPAFKYLDLLTNPALHNQYSPDDQKCLKYFRSMLLYGESLHDEGFDPERRVRDVVGRVCERHKFQAYCERVSLGKKPYALPRAIRPLEEGETLVGRVTLQALRDIATLPRTLVDEVNDAWVAENIQREDANKLDPWAERTLRLARHVDNAIYAVRQQLKGHTFPKSNWKAIRFFAKLTYIKWQPHEKHPREIESERNGHRRARDASESDGDDDDDDDDDDSDGDAAHDAKRRRLLDTPPAR